MENFPANDEQPIALVVDDDRAVRLLACALLEEAGFGVEQAPDGLEALSQFDRLRPNIVLLDVVMPEIDGFGVCREIRKSTHGRHIAVLMMTGLDDIDSINRAYDAGATDFITKPINWAILHHRLRYMWRASQMSDDLRKSEMKNRALINALPDLLLRMGKGGEVLELKEPGGFDGVFFPDGLLSRRIEEVFPAEVSEPIMTHLERSLTTGEMQCFEHMLQFGEHKHFYDWRIVNSGRDEVLAVVRDITERKKTEARIFRLAYHDILTGLLNRNSFKDHLGQALAQAQRNGRYVATLFIDLDRFKLINDTFGYNVGDLLLQSVAERIQDCVRKGDKAARHVTGQWSNSVSRLGGDEFTILLSEIKQAQDAAKVAKRILEAISMPHMIAGRELFVTGSIGITVYPLDGEDPDTLLKNADAAMYSAKEQGRNNFQFYSKAMNASSFRRLALETALRKALERGELLIHYQPLVEMLSGQISGLEALLRWKHPEMGIIPPNDFIPLAEETGLIAPIGEWVLCSACMQNKAFQARGLPPKRIAVNISSLQFRPHNLVAAITNALKISGLEPSYLEIELTETLLMKNMEESSEILEELKGMGVRVAIDDFGTGYSSLAYLKRFPLDTLKIDRSFTKDIPHDQNNAAIATAIIALAHSLGLSVVAEGVESEEQLLFMLSQGCDAVQGYYFSPALPAGEIEEYLRREPELTMQLGGILRRFSA